MTVTRRELIKVGLAGSMAASVPSILRAESGNAEAETLRMTNSLMTNLDPYSTTSYATVDHGLAIYDTLFALDSEFRPQPQMVERWGVSDDRKAYTFELRDGLGFHDGTPVSAADCVASVRRWFDTAGGAAVKQRAGDVSKLDDRRFTIVLKQPMEQLIEQLAVSTNYLLFVMREKDADRSPSEQVASRIGSGPFEFNEGLFRPGASYVYDRNEKYVPRREPSSGLAGGKVVKLNRVIGQVIGDPQTASSAMRADEIGLVKYPPANLFSAYKSDSNVVLEDIHKSGDNYFVRMNCLQKPFDNVKARQAVLHLIDQEACLNILSPDKEYTRPVTSLFGTNTPYTNDANTGWYKKGADPAKAQQLLKEAGYAGEKVVILQPTDSPGLSNASLILAAMLRKAGIVTELAPSSWAALAERRKKKDPVSEGGWSIYPTNAVDFSFSDPLSTAWIIMGGEYYGWLKNDEYEALRARWLDSSLDERKVLARKMQEIWWDAVPSVFLGQVISPIARRKSLRDLVGFPALLPLWNMQKV